MSVKAAGWGREAGFVRGKEEAAGKRTRRSALGRAATGEMRGTAAVAI